MTTTTTTTTEWISNVTLTEAEFNRELIICKTIFLDYTDYHLNAVLYRLVSEEKYRGDCMHLNSLYYLLTSYWFNSDENSYYLGGLPVDESDVQRVIDLVHHYGILQITVLASGFNNAQEGGYFCLDTVREIYASSTYIHTISVSSGCSLFQVFLNGSLISGNDWSYVGSTFTYLGSIVLQDDDWFYLHFKCGCSQGCSTCTGTTTTTTTQAEAEGYSVKFVSHVCCYTDVIVDTTTTTTTTIVEVEIHFVEHVCEMYESDTTTSTTTTSTTTTSTTSTTTTSTTSTTTTSTSTSSTTTTSTTSSTSTTTTTTTSASTVPFTLSVHADVPNLLITSVLLNGIELTVGDVISGVNQTGYIQPFTNGTLTVKWDGTPDHQTMTYWYDGNFRSVTMHAEDRTTGYTFNIPVCNSYLWVVLVKF